MTVRGAKYPRKPNDLYATPPETTRALLDVVTFRKRVCDPAAGNGAITDVLAVAGYDAVSGDIVDGYDFLTEPFRWPEHDIVTNPPFGIGGRAAVAFIERALEVTAPWQGTVAMLLPVDFDSGITRTHLFQDCSAFALKLVLLNRVRWFNGKSGSVNHAWFLWNHAYQYQPAIKYVAQQYLPSVLT